MTSRALLLALFFAILIGGMIMRLFQLQILEGGRLATAVDDSRVISELLPATRGRILDRHGVALADNRAAYHLGVVLSDLELASKPRRDLPFYRLDEQRFDELVADLVARLPPGRPNPRETLLRELLAHPGVAIRYGSRTHDTALALIAVPRQHLAPSGDDDGAELSNTAILAQSDLLCEDPRDALVREIGQRWDQKAECFTPGEFRAAAVALDERFGVTTERCFNVLDAFAPVVTLPPAVEGGPELRWHLLTDERRAQAEAALSRFLGVDPQHVHEPFAAALAAGREPPPRGPFLYAAAGNAQEIASLMPGASFAELALSGVPAARERVFIIQGDVPGGEGGLFRQLQDRLAASFGSPEQGDWVGALIERHGEKVRARTCERLYRLHQLALDPVRVERLCSSLAALLTKAGIATTALDVSQDIAIARRIADRQQQNQTHNDPITIVHDIPHRLAIALDGANALIPRDLAQQYDETETPLPGVTIQVGSGRAYPFPGSSSHIIGLIGRVDPNLNTQTALALGLDPNGWQGHTGLEAHYDSVLRGASGIRRRLRGPDGYSEPEKPEQPSPGQDLTTELDMELQLLAEDSLTRWFELAQNMGLATDKMAQARAVGQDRAGCVLMDCHTGALLVLASSPGYSIDDLRRHYADLNDPKKSPGQPLHDYASEASQPPGSCMKILTALAALEDQVITPGEEVVSNGYMALTKSGQKILRDHAPAGTYDLPKAIQFSCNIYFAKVGERMGGERMASYFHMFGMGENNALDVDQQRPGILPRPDTIAMVRKSEPHWVPSDSWRMAIGQFLSASPLQVVTIAAAVANGGHVVSPYLVKPAGMPVVKDLKIRKEYLAEIQHGMELVTDNREGATAKYLLLEGAAEGIKVAAKTGTSEWGSPASRESGRTPDHAWLIGYAPAENPVIAFAIFINSGTSGGRACSPVAKRLLEAYFARYGRGGHLHPVIAPPPVAAPPAPIVPHGGKPGTNAPGATHTAPATSTPDAPAGAPAATENGRLHRR